MLEKCILAEENMTKNVRNEKTYFYHLQISKGKERENNQRERQERERAFSISTRVYNIYLYRNRPVRPSIYLVSATPPNRLLDFYETLHSCSTQPADVHEGIPLLSKI